MAKDNKTDKVAKFQGVAAVDRALSILRVIEEAQTPLTVSDLARRAELYKSTCLRLLESLILSGLVIRTDDARYALGPALLRLGMAYQNNSRLEEKLLPVFRRMIAAGSESPSFFIRLGPDERLCVFRLDSNHSTLDRVRTGRVMPLDRGAAGHVIRAFDDGAEGTFYDRIRSEGHAMSFGETSPDCAAVAMPVFDGQSRLAGALSISGPQTRLNAATAADQLAILKSASGELGMAFGARPGA
jgi:DNA-binding IclR family transcriptional regulator